MGIIIRENFSDDDLDIFDKINNQEFESKEMLDLKVEAQDLSKETMITELKSYPKIKKNLEFDLPHQSQGALKILRDLNATALLADEVGLGKTITAGIVFILINFIINSCCVITTRIFFRYII